MANLSTATHASTLASPPKIAGSPYRSPIRGEFRGINSERNIKAPLSARRPPRRDGGEGLYPFRPTESVQQVFTFF